MSDHQEQHNSGMCRCETCKKKSTQFDFCAEHFEWFKWGLINKHGKKVRDFDKKWEAYVAHSYGKVQKVA